MILHTLANSTSLDACLCAVDKDDTILLLGDGVYCALPASEAEQMLRGSAAKVLVLNSDALAAGLDVEGLAFPTTDMAGFVALSEYYPRQLAWY
ncbi:sulfurtransferase complex subunit TusB [Halioglobus maricola]|uniref:Sulfurtransferase complex subunit TusB n=1 Tax=Halioglobus maricola TaxID=2601894 RepID=A0A5P9NMF6_9GAMM|nr:sulfurtransferase complex subunit TusB [Halioglobus maricola]QFU76108.1 sulfurtransferase complex subunit TusB [Halioglobus maricola]